MGKEDKYKKGLYALLVVGVLVGIIFIILQTNIIYKQTGSTITETLDISDKVGDETGAGYILLERNSETPSFLGSAKFEDGDLFSYFTISQYEDVKRKIIVNFPEGLESGKYYFDANIYLNGKTYKVTYGYSVR